MTPEELREIGEEIYGKRWQSPLARALDVDARSVRRWLSGQHNINERTAKAVMSLAASREGRR
jgi:hypothetical protein